MLHLFNNQIGFAKRKIGFPSVDSCNAIVYQTRQGLCGLHNYGGDSPFQFGARAEAFAAFVQECNITHRSHSQNLYSVVNKRYNSRDKDTRQVWIDEMKAFAAGLGFTGTVWLIALIKHLDAGSVYIQYDLNSAKRGCDVTYKKWSKLQEIRVADGAPSLGELKKDMAVWNQSMGQTLRYTRGEPTEVVGRVVFKSEDGGTMWSAMDDDNAFCFSFSCG